MATKPKGAATITDGIDVPSKFKESTESADARIATLVASAEESSFAGKDAAKDGPVTHRKEFGSRGNSSLVVIYNRTAARLTLDRHSDRAGHIYEESAFPRVLEPGSNGAFLHVSKTQDSKDGSKGLLVYRINVYDDVAEKWKDSSFSIAFSWETGKHGAPNAVRLESDKERIIAHTGTKYDLQKICGKAEFSDKNSPSPVYEITLSQKKCREGEIPISVKVADKCSIM